MKVFKFFCFLLLIFSIFTLPISSSSAKSGQVAPGSSGGKELNVEGTRHRLTGTVTMVDADGGTVMVKGRRGELTFDLNPEKAEIISPGERVRVYYVTTPDKKNVVIRVKKINNGNETEGGKRGLKGLKQSGK